MKKLFAVLIFVVAAVVAATGYQQVQGIYVDGSTNTVTVAGVATNVNYVAAGISNRFNLSQNLNGQDNTNLWPAIPFFPHGADARNVGIGVSFTAQGTNATSILLRFAASVDGATNHWVSNYFTFAITANGTATVNAITNCDLFGYPFLALQEIVNTNGSIALTNFWIGAADKPGL